MATTNTRTRKTTTRRRPQPEAPKVQAKTVRQTKEHTADLTEPGTDTERNFQKLLAKDPNGTHQEFVQWFEEQTGVTLDVKTVQYTLATYAEFQRSPEHRAVTQAKRQAAAEKAAKAAAAKRERALKAAKAAGLEVVES